jgi:serralysin
MKAKLLFSLALGTLILNSCQNEKIDDGLTQSSNQNKQVNVCIDKTPFSNSNDKGSVLTDYRWTNGQSVHVYFLNGTSFLQSKVQQFAIQWKNYANINLIFDNNPSAEIQINFDNSGQSWSYYGNLCTQVPDGQTTMNFGWFNQYTSDSEFSRTVLHEFGHALGLIHEQSSPNQNIQWNYPAVYAYYGGYPNYFTTEQIDNWIFARFSQTQTNSSSYDPESIMHYPVPAEHTLNGFSVGWNYYLSNTDKDFIASVYPYPPGSQIAATFYKHDNYNPSGYAIGLPVGEYTLSQLQARGILNDDISSVKVVSGHKVTMYRDDYFQNSYIYFYNDYPNFYNFYGWNFNDLTSSIKIVRL